MTSTPQAPQPPSGRGRLVQCRECTIFIGEGYQETVPFPHPDGKGYVCWRCYESLQRVAERRRRQQQSLT